MQPDGSHGCLATIVMQPSDWLWNKEVNRSPDGLETLRRIDVPTEDAGQLGKSWQERTISINQFFSVAQRVSPHRLASHSPLLSHTHLSTLRKFSSEWPIPQHHSEDSIYLLFSGIGLQSAVQRIHHSRALYDIPVKFPMSCSSMAVHGFLRNLYMQFWIIRVAHSW